MILSKGKRILQSFKQCPVLLRYISVPQETKTSDESLTVTKTKVKKDSFLKSAFIGKLDDEFLQYNSCKSPEFSDSIKRFIQSTQESDNEESISCFEKFKKLAANGFFLLSTPGHGEEVVSMSELLRLYEELNLSPDLSALLELHTTYIIPVLSNYGSPELKDSYLKRVLSGEISGAFAVCEKSASDPTGLKSTAIEKGGEYIFRDTEKYWITNALNADFFITLARTQIVNLITSEGSVGPLTAFIVDKNNKITLEKQDLIGLNQCGTAKVKFSDISIPQRNILGTIPEGYAIVSEGIKSPKFLMLICILSNLKKIISDTVQHINSRKLFPRDLKDSELVKNKLANIVYTAYVFESMLYFTADLMDRYEIDTTLESSLLQIYGFENAMNAISLCMELLGSKSYDKDFPYEKLWSDLKGLSFFNPTQFTRIAAALTGLEYAGNRLKEQVIAARNPLKFPFEAFKKMYSTHQVLSDKIKPTTQLYMNLHPSLKEAAEQLDYSLSRFRFSVEALFLNHGVEVINRQIALNKLTDIALEIFAMTCVLSRASHSYCTGLQHCDQEVLITKSLCFKSEKRIKQLMDSILTVNDQCNDAVSIDIGDFTLQKKLYFIAHPSVHNI